MPDTEHSLYLQDDCAYWSDLARRAYDRGLFESAREFQQDAARSYRVLQLELEYQAFEVAS